MGHVYYHHPEDRQFSLDFADPDPERIVGYDGDVAVKVLKYDLDIEFYAIYTSRGGGGAVKDLEFDLTAALADMAEDNATIVLDFSRSIKRSSLRMRRRKEPQ